MDVAARAGEIAWYHTIELPGGVITPGYFDHRAVVGKLPMPASLAGKRCLDVASADGFFAFEMARRGGEVVSLDMSDTSRQDYQGVVDREWSAQSSGRANQAFEVAREALGLDVERVDASVYDIDPEALGRFDYVFIGNILLHLADPARALRAVRSVTAGELLSFEAISTSLTALQPFTPCAQLYHLDDARWWTVNLAGHRRILEAGGFEVTGRGLALQPFGAGAPRRQKSLPSGPRELWRWLVTRRWGAATAWARAVPVHS